MKHRRESSIRIFFIRKFSSILFFTLSAAIITSCTSKKNENEVSVGVMGAMSGGTAPLGNSLRNGVQLAIDEANANGGVLGKKLKLVIRDDEAKNERGAQLIQELLDQEKVVVIFGPTNTGVADASARYPNLRKVPQFNSVSSGAKVNELFKEFPENYIFRFAVSDEIQSRLIAKEAIENRKSRKPAIICDETNFGQAGRDRLEKHLATMKVTPVYVGKFKIKDTDMTAQIQQAKAAGADVIMSYGLGPELSAMSNTMEKLGFKVPVVGAWTMSMSSYINNAGKNAEGNSMPMSFIEESEHTERAKSFLKNYYEKFKEKPIPSALAAAQSYDAASIYLQAVTQVQSFEGPKVKAALENLKESFRGVTGEYDRPYSATDHESMKESHLEIGVIKDGKVVPKKI